MHPVDQRLDNECGAAVATERIHSTGTLASGWYMMGGRSSVSTGPSVGEQAETPEPMTFWLKRLAGERA
jgi:hypothetical protein